MTRVDQAGELAIVARLQQIYAGDRPDAALDPGDDGVTIGIGDDAAVVRAQGALALCVDSVEAGCDWLPGVTPPEAIGHRAAAVNLSDLAAMGAAPRWLLVALRLAPDDAVADLERAAAGLQALAQAHGARVVGGDLDIGPGPQRWTVAAAGEIRGWPLARSQARPGDVLWLIGEVGHAAFGLRWLTSHAGSFVGELAWPVAETHPAHAHLVPRPLVAAGCALAEHGAGIAAIDVSDGLWLDAERLARASGVDLTIDLPRPAWLSRERALWCDRAGFDWRAACAAGGDDYALLVAAPAEVDVTTLVARADPTARLQRIGHAAAGRGEVRVQIDGIDVAGARHGHLYGKQ